LCFTKRANATRARNTSAYDTSAGNVSASMQQIAGVDDDYDT